MANKATALITAFIPFGSGDKTELLRTRNRALTARYFYYFHLLRKRHDDVFIILSEREFFIKPDTIYRIVTDTTQNNYLNELINTHATPARLQKEFPGWRWQ